MSVIIFIIILGVLVFVHELGHFAMAKFFGVRVDEFGMGFPPRAAKLFKKGETEYTLNWIPFGGFVKIHGEDPLESGELDPDYKRSLVSKAWWKQILVLVAGVTMNVILAWFLFSISYMIGAPTPAGSVQDPETLRNPHLTVLAVLPETPADAAGLRAGDRIEKATTDTAILSNATQEGFVQFVRSSEPGQAITLDLENAGEERQVTLVPAAGADGNPQSIGVSIDVVGTYRFGFFESIWQGIRSSVATIGGTVRAFGNIFAGNASFSDVTGPVGLVGVVGDAQKIGFSYLLILSAVISINLAVINLVPFPALDGGRILFVIIEKIIRRPLPKKFVEWSNVGGFFILIGLMLLVTVKDVINLF